MDVWRKRATRYRLNGKTVKKETPRAKRETIQSKRWYATIRTADGKRKQVPLTEDRETSQTLMRRLQTDEDRYLAYGIDQCQREREKPLDVHLDAYEEYLRNKGNTAEYVSKQVHRIRELVRSTKAKTIDGLDAGRIGRTLATWRERDRPHIKGRSRTPLSVSSSNHYMRAIKGFSRWLWIEKRTNEDVLRNLRLMNAKAHKTRERRALTTQELATLIESTETCGKRLYGFRDTDRAMLYTLAAYTGLRASELASLTVSSFDIDNAIVTVEAGYSKRRRKDVLPLHPSLVKRIVPWLETKTKALWPSGLNTTRILQRCSVRKCSARGSRVLC
jgi:site-specific recombinase XerD